MGLFQKVLNSTHSAVKRPRRIHVNIHCTLLWCSRPRSFWSAPRIGPLAVFNTGSPRFTDFPSLCACSESSLTNLIGSGLNLLCLQSHSKPECRWSWPEVAIFGADQKERGLWGREWHQPHLQASSSPMPGIQIRPIPKRLGYRENNMRYRSFP